MTLQSLSGARFHSKSYGLDKISDRFEDSISVLSFLVWCKDAVNSISTSLEATGAYQPNLHNGCRTLTLSYIPEHLHSWYLYSNAIS